MLDLVRNPENQFSHVEAQITINLTKSKHNDGLGDLFGFKAEISEEITDFRPDNLLYTTSDVNLNNFVHFLEILQETFHTLFVDSQSFLEKKTILWFTIPVNNFSVMLG